MVVINTELCCSKPTLLHIQEYSGHNETAYDKIGAKNFDAIIPVIDNSIFVIYDIPTPNTAGLGVGSSSRILLFKDNNKTFDDLFNDLEKDHATLTGFTEILGKYRSYEIDGKKVHNNVRMFMIPNKSMNPKLAEYQLSCPSAVNKRFSLFLYSATSTPSYASL